MRIFTHPSPFLRLGMHFILVAAFTTTIVLDVSLIA
jgi:hypothetical protein